MTDVGVASAPQSARCATRENMLEAALRSWHRRTTACGVAAPGSQANWGPWVRCDTSSASWTDWDAVLATAPRATGRRVHIAKRGRTAAARVASIIHTLYDVDRDRLTGDRELRAGAPLTPPNWNFCTRRRSRIFLPFTPTLS